MQKLSRAKTTQLLLLILIQLQQELCIIDAVYITSVNAATTTTTVSADTTSISTASSTIIATTVDAAYTAATASAFKKHDDLDQAGESSKSKKKKWLAS